MNVRVIVVDDQALVRHGLVGILDHDEGITVVGEAADGREAVRMCATLRPDVVLMDVRMPRMTGLEAMQAILDDPETSAVRIAVLTTFEIDEYIDEAMRMGASGFLAKDMEPDLLRTSVHAIARGEIIMSPTATRHVVDRFRSQGTGPVRVPDEVDSLTPREREVVELVADGLGNDEIAERLFMSPATARTHVSRAMSKLGARDRAHLVVLAYRFGLAPPRS